VTYARGAILAGLSFLALALFYLRAPYLYDTDSYLHLAVARLYTEQGFVEGLPWTRFSVMGEAYGDKELLFHVALMPFAASEDPATSGRIALAIFGAAVLTTVGALAARYAGWVGWLVPWWLLLAAAPWNNRLTRLRPELFALILLLVAAELMVRRRWFWLACTAAAFTLSYTAFHVLIGLVGIWATTLLFLERRFEWRAIAAACGGTAAGLLAHPHPADHLRIWYLQNVLFFRMKDVLDVGAEILAPPWHLVVLVLGGWWVVIAILALRAWRSGSGAFRSRAFAVYGIAAAVFLVLFLSMGRMVLYFAPFATLAAIVAAGQVPWPRPWRIALAVGLVAALLTGAFFTTRIDHILATLAGGESVLEADLEQLGKAIPPGARVAAPWDDGQLFAFWAPQGRYLNLYDPLFMAVASPSAYRAQRDLFEGRAADPAALVRGTLQSDYVAIHQVERSQTLVRQLAADPRFEVVYAGRSVLFRLADVRGNP
jgi:hypothetical protein